jgi:predicted permease
VGVTLGLAIGLLGPIGTVLVGGFLANHLSARDLRWGAWLSAIGALVLVPCYVFLSLANSGTMAMAAYLIPAILGVFFQGPSLALLQSVTPVTMRATSAAIALFIANMIGLGLGPLSVGLLSDGLNASYGVDSLRYALLIVPCMALAAGYVYWRGSGFILADINRADAASQN